MQWRFERDPVGFQFMDLDTIDGAPDAGPQWIGHGKTRRAAVEDFIDMHFDNWLEVFFDEGGYDPCEFAGMRQFVLRGLEELAK